MVNGVPGIGWSISIVHINIIIPHLSPCLPTLFQPQCPASCFSNRSLLVLCIFFSLHQTCFSTSLMPAHPRDLSINIILSRKPPLNYEVHPFLYAQCAISLVIGCLPASFPPRSVPGGQTEGLSYCPLYLHHLTGGRQPINIYQVNRKMYNTNLFSLLLRNN